MTKPKTAPALRWQAHTQHLAGRIGARPPGSAAESAAADYVKQQLTQVGLPATQRTYPVVTRSAVRTVPQLLLAALLAGAAPRLPLPLRLGLGLLALWHHRRIVQGRPAAWEIPWETSHSVLTRIPAQGELRQRVLISAALDSGRHRPAYHPAVARRFPHLLAAAQGFTLLNALLPSFPEKSLRQALVTGFLGGLGIAALLDSSGDAVPGANGNAAALALMLELAVLLHQEALAHTEVWLAFLGSTTTSRQGMQRLLDEYAAPLQDAAFIHLDHVGAGELAWVTVHHLDSSAPVRPHPAMLAHAEAAARQQPELAVMGRAMPGLSPLTAVYERGLRGITLMGYDRLSGLPVNRYQPTDSPSNLQDTAMERSWQYLLALLQQLDRA